MTGNDIVDKATAAAESNTKRKGFLEKLFTPRERIYISEASEPADIIWRLWTMKESCYKIYIRQSGGRFFAPKKFDCRLSDPVNGTVHFNNNRFLATTVNHENYMYSVAFPRESVMNPLANCCFMIPQMNYDDQQQYIFEKIIKTYKLLAGNNISATCVMKDEHGIPFLVNENDHSKIPVSITHHGHYAAFTIN